jgi:hypothetical protein
MSKKLMAGAYQSDVVSLKDQVEATIAEFEEFYSVDGEVPEIGDQVAIPDGLEETVARGVEFHKKITWNDKSNGFFRIGNIPMPKTTIFGDGNKVRFRDWVDKNGVQASLVHAGKVAGIVLMQQKGDIGVKGFYHKFEPGEEWDLLVDAEDPHSFFLSYQNHIVHLDTGINNV